MAWSASQVAHCRQRLFPALTKTRCACGACARVAAAVGGAMSWGEAKALAPFNATHHPFRLTNSRS